MRNKEWAEQRIVLLSQEIAGLDPIVKRNSREEMWFAIIAIGCILASALIQYLIYVGFLSILLNLVWSIKNIKVKASIMALKLEKDSTALAIVIAEDLVIAHKLEVDLGTKDGSTNPS